MGRKVLNAKFSVLSKKTYLELFDCIKRNRLITLLLVLAFIVHMFVILPSGQIGCIDGKCGMHFWGANEHDGIWHVALTQVSFGRFPFTFPTFAGANLSGYNFILDIFIWIISLVGISPWDTYFRIMPVLWFMFFSFVLYHFSRLLHKDKVFTAILYFFMFFSSSFGFIIQFQRNGNIFGSSGTPTMQGALGMTNPQFMWSVALVLAVQLLLHKRKNAFVVAIFAFIIAGLKVYALVPLAIIFAVYLCFFILKNELTNFFKYAIAAVIPIVLAYYIFYSGNKSGGIFWDLLAVPKQIVEDPNMWPIPSLVADWYALKNTLSIGPKYIYVVSQIAMYFVLFNFGIRLVGLYSPIHYLIQRNFEKLFLILTWLGAAFVATLMPIFFVQSGDWWNTIQFMYFGFIFANILAADTVYILWKKNVFLASVILIVCVAVFLPSQIDLLRTFAFGGSSYIASDEIEILSKLKSLPNGVVLVQPFERNDENVLPNNYDTAYVSALSGKQTYYADKKQLELLNIEYKEREEELFDNAKCVNSSDIIYIYLRKNTKSFDRFNKCAKDSGQFVVKEENKKARLWIRL